MTHHTGFAQDVLAGSEGFLGKRRVHVGPGADDDGIDLRVIDDRPPVVDGLREPRGRAERLHVQGPLHQS